MNKIKKQFKNQTGIILLLTLFILSGILIITLGAADLVMSGLKMNRLTGYSNLSFFASEAGVEKALWEARKNNYVLPDVDTPNVFSFSLGNQGTYQINYSTSSPNVTFTSVGSYLGAKRSVESTYSASSETEGGTGCLPSCDGKVCGDDGCGSVCGTCSANEMCLFGACIVNSRIYVCGEKPSTGTEWNTVSLYVQSWVGGAWSPADDPTTEYNATADTASCRYTCATNYNWNGSACVANTQTYTCAAKPVTGTDWNTVSSYAQTWTGSAWSPADSTTAYNTTASSVSCRYTCSSGYVYNGTSCVLESSYVKLLLHMDGTDASTTFTDSETTPKTVTAVGNAQIDTAQYKFGTASGLFDGTGDYLTVPDSDDWYFGTGDFTIDTWVRFATNSVDSGICGQRVNIDNTWEFWRATDPWNLLVFSVRSGGFDTGQYTVSFVPIINTWYHLELVRTGTNVYIFINGISQTLTVGQAIGINVVPNLAAVLEVGAVGNHSGVMQGYLDEFRITKGVARHTSNFTPPTAPSLAIGQNYGGGKIAYIDGTGSHGLIVTLADQSAAASWGCSGTVISGADGTAYGTGLQNTIDIMAGCATAGIAARLCRGVTINGYSDWFLPAAYEATYFYTNKVAIDAGLTSAGYQTSSELDSAYARYIYMGDGGALSNMKTTGKTVRCVRTF